MDAVGEVQAIFYKDSVIALCVDEAGELTSEKNRDLSYQRDTICLPRLNRAPEQGRYFQG